MFYIIEDNSHRTKTAETLFESFINDEISADEFFEESMTLDEGEVTSAIGDSLLGKKLYISANELKAKVKKVHEAVDVYFDTCDKLASKLSWHFRKKSTEYRSEIHSRIDARLEKGLAKGKFTLTLQLPIPVFAKDEKSRTQSAYRQIIKQAEAKLPKEFAIGLNLNRGIGVSSTAYYSQVWLASERFIIEN